MPTKTKPFSALRPSCLGLQCFASYLLQLDGFGSWSQGVYPEHSTIRQHDTYSSPRNVYRRGFEPLKKWFRVSVLSEKSDLGIRFGSAIWKSIQIKYNGLCSGFGTQKNKGRFRFGVHFSENRVHFSLPRSQGSGVAYRVMWYQVPYPTTLTNVLFPNRCCVSIENIDFSWKEGLQRKWVIVEALHNWHSLHL